MCVIYTSAILAISYSQKQGAMNSENLSQLLQKGFHVSLGVTAFVVETLQDAQKRTQNLEYIQTELNQLAADWAAKGEITEKDSRTFVENLLQSLKNQPANSPSPTAPESEELDDNSTPRETTAANVQQDLQELTAQSAAIRALIRRYA